MADIIPFPRPPLEGPAPVRKREDGTVEEIRVCEDPLHVFAMPFGRCQCGEVLWEDPPDLDE